VCTAENIVHRFNGRGRAFKIVGQLALLLQAGAQCLSVTRLLVEVTCDDASTVRVSMWVRASESI
jgi:hypothetical protein